MQSKKSRKAVEAKKLIKKKKKWNRKVLSWIDRFLKISTLIKRLKNLVEKEIITVRNKYFCIKVASPSEKTWKLKVNYLNLFLICIIM